MPEPETSALPPIDRNDATASGQLLAGIALMAAGGLMRLVVGETIDWLGALFLAWGVAGGVICFGNAMVEALGLNRRKPSPTITALPRPPSS